MSKTKISEYSATANSNTDVGGINIDEGCAPSGINDAIRTLMAQLKNFQTGTGGDSFNGPIGSTTPAAGAFTTLSATSSGTGLSVNRNSTSPNQIALYNSNTLSGYIGATSTAIVSFGDTSGSEKARIDSSGNLGLGVTPSAWTVAGNMEFSGKGSIAGSSSLSSNGLFISSNAYYGSLGWTYKSTAAASRYLVGSGAHYWYTAPSGTADTAITFTQAMTLDASGNLLIGTTNAGVGGLGVENATNINFPESATTAYATMFRQAGSAALALNYGYAWSATSNGWASSISTSTARSSIKVGAGAIDFYTNTASTVAVGTDITPTPRMTIDSSGNLLVGTTSVGGNGGITLAPNADDGAGRITFDRATTTASSIAIVFENANATSGQISYTNTATTYSTSSDYRLKENIAPMTGALATVAQLKPCTYTWKQDGSEGQGFIAHELQAVVPDAVVGDKDATKIQQYEISPAVPATFDEEGNELTPAVEAVMGEREVPLYQGIDTSFLVATLTAAMQEQQALIAALTDRIAALESN